MELIYKYDTPQLNYVVKYYRTVVQHMMWLS